MDQQHSPGRPLEQILPAALAARHAMLDERHETACRLFNGFYEGCTDLAIDLYARTLLIHNYAEDPATTAALITVVKDIVLTLLPWITAIVVKDRSAATPAQRRGSVIYGTEQDLARRVREHGVAYAIDLLLNRDASLYLDTRNLRRWLKEQMGGKTVLNTFAYTGSLGVAARAGGAARVVHLDLNRNFLNVAKTSYSLNGLPIARNDFLAGDFWPTVGRLRHTEERFDCVVVDPPFFASTDRGKVDLEGGSERVINKVRPLIEDGGTLVAINNALFVSGAAYIKTLERLCAGGYLQIDHLVPIPEDFTGFPETRVSAAPVDPAPFNHPTKIAVLSVRRRATV